MESKIKKFFKEKSSFLKDILFFILPIVIFLILWEIISTKSIINPILFPSPSKVFKSFILMAQKGILMDDILSSLWRALLGLLIGTIMGIISGVFMGFSRSVEKIFLPLFLVFKSFPPVAIIPLVIIWFGIDDTAKIFSISFAVFFPVWINTLQGVKNINQFYLWNAKILTDSKTKIILKVILPAITPFIVTGIRMSISISFIMVFVSELSGASKGLGYRISISQLNYQTDQMISSLLVLSVISVIIEKSFLFIVKKIIPWYQYQTK